MYNYRGKLGVRSMMIDEYMGTRYTVHMVHTRTYSPFNTTSNMLVKHLAAAHFIEYTYGT